MKSKIHISRRVRRSQNPLTNYTKLSKMISALWKSKERIQQTDKHVFVKNREFQWKISLHQSPTNTVAQAGEKRLQKPPASLLLLK